MNIIILLFVILFSGCSSKYIVNIRALAPGVVNDKSIKNISVLNFKNDNIAQSIQVESSLNNLYINGKKYFNVIDRKNLDKIIKEKKLDFSGLVNTKNNHFELAQVDSLVIGKINLNNSSDSYFKEKRTDYDTCIKSKTITSKHGSYQECLKYKTYYVKCLKRKYTLETSIKIIKTNNSKTLFSKTYDKFREYKHCEDDQIILPTKKDENTKLAGLIANDFVRDIAPHYNYFYAVFLDDCDVDLDNEDIFEVALKLIKAGRIIKAQQIFKNLYTKYPNSYVISYDYALTLESMGNLYSAQKLLIHAENLAIQDGKVIDEIENSIRRVNNNIIRLHEAKKQF